MTLPSIRAAALFGLLLAGLVCVQAQNVQGVSAQSSAPQDGQQGDDSAPTFKVDVRLVNVFVSVTDNNGTPIANLSKNDFTIFEDDAPQQISVFGRESELPLSIVMCVDTSLSTRKDIRL